MSLAVRIVVEHSPTFYEILGLQTLENCPPVIQVAGYDRTFYRSRSCDRWVLYKAALTGWGETTTLDPRQQ